jgi:hypothetical protein
MGLTAGLACSVKLTGLPLLAFYYCLSLASIWIARGPNRLSTVYGPLAAIGTAVVIVYMLNPFFWPFESPRMLLEFPNLFVRTREAFVDVPGSAWGEPPDRLGIIHERLFFSSFWSFPWEIVLAAGGLGICGWRLVRGLRERRVDPAGAAAIYLLANYIFIVSLIQFDFVRYYVPTVFSMKLVAAIGFGAVTNWLWQRIKGRGRPGERGEPPNGPAIEPSA